ncbi:hypothetical protein KKC17_02275 [Patescibacteria group bacterium]|nr:hypothetical protein [Patescibacteria group bacterium]
MATKKELSGKKSQLASTVSHLAIQEIREDAVVLKDGTLRAVLLCSSVNFVLKSEQEQEAIIQGYVQFLNSLEFPLQIVIQSRRLNIDGYLDKLGGLLKQQTNELLRVQMTDYIGYIKELIGLGDIMTKRFYVVVPYNPGADKSRGFWQRLVAIFSAAKSIQLSRERFVHYLESLEQRVYSVSGGLSSLGLKSVRLDTQGLVELYYTSYNPELSQQQKLVNMDKLEVEAE